MLRKTAAALALATIVSLGAQAPASAEERTCQGTIGATTVDNLHVPSGATCNLNGTRVKGSITVGRNATLVAKGIQVTGNVQAEGAKDVRVNANSRVGGSVQIVQGAAGRVINSTVGGNVLFDDNTGKVTAYGSTVGSDVQAFQNTGGVSISLNNVDGNLQCKENRPAPTGSGNIVDGNKEDQCRRL